MNPRCIPAILAILLLEGSLHPQTPPTIPELVRQLGDPKFAVREAAQKELLKRGESIAPELIQLTKTADAETAERLRKVLHDLVGYKESIRRMLSEIKADHEPISNDLIGVIAAHQPGAGDLLLKILAEPADRHRLHAVRAFIASWDSATADQLEAYLRECVTVYTSHRTAFPAKVGAMISFETRIRDGWTGWPPLDKKLDFRTRTARYLNGKPYEEPFVYKYPFATVGWFRLGELTEGKHTIHAVMEYELTHKGVKRKGELRSKDSHFEIVAANTPDDLVAPPTAALSKTLRTSFRVIDCEKLAVKEVPYLAGLSDVHPISQPQITWTDMKAGLHGLTCTNWNLAADLPVDLCFDAEIHEVKTGKIHAGDPLIAVRHKTASGYISPRDARAFAKDRDGFVAVKIVLKPSRALALTDQRITKYYPEPITSDEIRMKITTPTSTLPLTK